MTHRPDHLGKGQLASVRRIRLAVLLLGLVVVVQSSWAADPGANGTGLTRVVQAVTSTGRQGAYYLPPGHESHELPLLVFFHGTGGKGSLAILRLRALAAKVGFIVLAPDSVSAAGIWTVGQRPGETTEDRRHVLACVRELLTVPGVHIDVAHVLAAGFSVGGNVAAHLATHDAIFTDLAVLHGHIGLGAMGPRRPRTWVSAGDRDRVRTAEYMRSVAEQLGQQGFRNIALRVFRGDHTLQDEELTGLIAWWLGHERETR